MNLKEYNARRIYNALVRRFSDGLFFCFWVFHLGLARRNNERIQQFKDRYKGQRCFILGNGPMLERNRSGKT